MAADNLEHLGFKQFIQKLRTIELDEAYIVINANVSTKLYEYAYGLSQIKFVDGWYHTYYGNIKLIINNFINYWVTIINDTIKEADTYKNTIDKAKLLEILTQSIEVQKERQYFFCESYLPAENQEEQRLYDAMLQKYNQFVQELLKMKNLIEQFDKPSLATKFAAEQFEKSFQKKCSLLNFTHTYISEALMRVLNRIRTSLIECHGRVKINLEELQEERDQKINALLNCMYDLNKQQMALSRRERRCSLELAEVNCSIGKIRNKIENYQKASAIPRLEDEMKYWDFKLKEFTKIKNTADKIIAERENLVKQEQIYNSLRCTELPGEKLDMFKNIGVDLQKAKKFYTEKYLDIARALFTFFAVRGLNRIIYEDNVGKYALDDYGHQIYFFDYGRKICHVTCDGEFRQVKEYEKYFFDGGGRYVKDTNGEHLYQAAYCTSLYRLGCDDILHKVSKDCGHSEHANRQCRMQLKDPTNVEILPNIVPVDIKGTLSTGVVQYLWDTFGQILPRPLAYLGNHWPINPIHTLAHELIQYGYSRTNEEIRRHHAEAKDYRTDVYTKREQKAIAEFIEWKSKQSKPCKPWEIDDTQESDQQRRCTVDRELVFGLNYYN